MKRRIIRGVLLFLLILCFMGCSFVREESRKVDVKDVIHNIEEPRVDDKNILVGLYLDGKLVNSYESSFPKLSDMVSFDVYYSRDEVLGNGSQKERWNSYYQNYEDIDDYRVGFRIQFKTDKEEFDKYIFNPGDVESFFNYIQIYLYDDIHQDGSFYSHVSKEEFNDSVIFTSIKLTGSVYIDEVISPVILSVFVYNKSDIDSNGKYIGSNLYKIEIIRK